MSTIHLLIRGKVQGVFYRATANDIAKENGITGWIKNTPASDVEAVISGTKDQLEKFTEWCRQGPRRAQVSEVVITEIEEEDFAEFTVIRV